MWLMYEGSDLDILVVQSVFFFKQKTAYEMRISDWSSDGCSSDLAGQRLTGDQARREQCAGLVDTVLLRFADRIWMLACNQVIEQAAEEDRHHQFERQVDADRGAEDRHAETRTAALQPFVERDHQRADHRAEFDHTTRKPDR